MKNTKVVLAVALMALAGSAMAKNADTLQTVTVSGAHQGNKTQISSETYEGIGGIYQLANGQTLSVTRLRNRVYAELGDQDKTQIVQVGKNQFVAVNKSVQLSFVPEQADQATQVAVQFVAASK